MKKKESLDIVLKSVQPNVGIEEAYRRRIVKLIDEMHKSVMYWLLASYKENEPVMAADGVTIAQDALPAKELSKTLKELADQWLERFDDASDGMADFFGQDVLKRNDSAMKKILQKGGLSVKFKPTRASRDVLAATVAENVQLIRSIPQEYLNDVQGLVMRSVTTGRDIGKLRKQLQHRYGLTRNRATTIAIDQNNKATSAFTRTRQVELGINEAVWKHSHAGIKPRPTHVKMDGKRYDVRKGMWDPAVKRYIFPGELIRCRCRSQSVIPGFKVTT